MEEKKIFLERSRFNENKIEQYGMGAGIIPIYVDENGDAKVLLGRERYVNQWKGSCRWSGFEGARKDGEHLVDAAIREFREESMDVVIDPDELRKAILDQDYYIRIVMKVLNDRKPERYHVTYIVLVDWDPDLPNRFQSIRSHVEYVERLRQEWNHIRPSFLGEEGEEVGPVQEMGNGSYVVQKNVSSSPCILQVPWNHDSLNSNFLRAEINDERCRDLKHWKLVRERLGRAVSRTHVSIQSRYDDTWGLVQNVHVSHDFLEKDQIRWWSTSQLHQVLNGRGQVGAERFRPYFLPVLQTLLTELKNMPPKGIRSVALAKVSYSPECFCELCEDSA